MMGWQPIETAPTVEGEDVLLAVNNRVLMGAFFRKWDYDRYAHRTDYVWVISGGRVVKPTHWMPIPEPPNSPNSGGVQKAGLSNWDKHELAE